MKAHAFTVYSAAQAIPLPKRIASEAQHVHEARIAFIKRMGTNWLHHPAYVPNPRHSPFASIYREARKPFLAEIAANAAADRKRNPAFKNAEKVRVAIGEAT